MKKTIIILFALICIINTYSQKISVTIPCPEMEEGFFTSYDYDRHGNITKLNRYGMRSPWDYGLIDSLSLDYGESNRLQSVNNAGQGVLLSTSYNFKDYASNDTEYLYNANGAMTQDQNSGISTILYNAINLPLYVGINNRLVEASNVYTYSADGRKLSAHHQMSTPRLFVPIAETFSNGNGEDANSDNFTDPNSPITINLPQVASFKDVEYCGNIIYENSALKMILTDNGYYDGQNYYFYIKNHLGSNVMTVREDGSIMQNNHYYPFGLTMGISDNQGTQPYKYTGKELDMEHGLNIYDFEARQYNPAIGRFLSMDPLCEKYYSVSPYAYCLNNPVKFVDPNGMEVYYLPDGTRLGQLGDNEDIRVINAQMSVQDARAHFESGSDEAISALMGESVAFADYFTTVSDVTNGASVVPFNFDGQKNCYTAAEQQMSNEGYGVVGSKDPSTIFTSVGVSTDNPNNLAENAVGGAIKIMTDLKNGKPVMVGVAQSNNAGHFNMQSGNTNPRTSHFIVINSSTAGNGAASFGYLDNAKGSGPINLNTSTGGISGEITGRGPVKTYSVSEVRNSWKIRK